MKGFNPIGFYSGVFLVVAMVGGVSAAQEKESTPLESAGIATGPGSLNGTWVRADEKNGVARNGNEGMPNYTMTTADGSPIPLLPWAAAITNKRLEEAAEGHPFASTKARCLPDGVPDMITGPGPTQILESPDQITMLREVLTYFRIVRLNQKHMAHPVPTLLGDAVAHWEGDTLVVDSIGLSTESVIKNAIPHTDALHVVERFHRTGKDTMQVWVTIEDPKTFSRPWNVVSDYKRIAGSAGEYYCENNRDFINTKGQWTGKATAN